MARAIRRSAESGEVHTRFVSASGEVREIGWGGYLLKIRDVFISSHLPLHSFKLVTCGPCAAVPSAVCMRRGFSRVQRATCPPERAEGLVSCLPSLS